MSRSPRILAVASAVAVVFSIVPAHAEDEVAPVVRLALGPAFHTAPAKSTEIAFDGTLGVNFAPAGWKHAGPVLSAEIGYAYDGVDLHAFQVAPSLGYGHPAAYVSYTPRLLVGSAIGVRNGISMHLLGDLMSLEIAHQWARFDGEGHHDIRLMFGVNPGAFVFIMSKL